MKKVNSFLVQMSFKDAIDSLSNEQAGCVFKGLFHYVQNGSIPNCDSVSKAVLLIFKSSVDEAKRRYEEKCKKAKDSANQRWNNIQSDANECERIQSDANECDGMPNDNEDDNEDDNEYKKNGSIPNGLESIASNNTMPEIRLGSRLFLDNKDFIRVQKMWNDTCESFRRVVKLTSKTGSRRNNRKGKIYACLEMLYKEEGTKERAFELLQEVFNKVEKSKFLAGDNPRIWKADFDWVMQIPHLIKIIEGNYDK